MNTFKKIIIILFVFLIYSCAIRNQVPAQQRNTSFQVFYDQLGPYGQWADYPNYGYVWIPDVGADFSPYSTNGYWVMTEYGWTWVSNYTWGWAPFHYGRWDYDNNYGWFWVPDNEWGPSWVIWRRADSYYGWTPMRPGIGINQSYGDEFRDYDRWNFVRYQDFGRQDMDRYYIDRRDNETIYRNSTIINNTYVDNSRNVTYITGPQRDDVRRVSGNNFRSYTVRDNGTPGEKLNNNRLMIYRPQVERNNNPGQMIAPSKITNLNDVRPVGERNSANQRNNVTPMNNNTRVNQQTDGNRHQQQNQQVQQQRQEQQQQQPQRIEQPQPQQQKQPEQVLQRQEQQKKETTSPSVNTRREKQKNTTTTPVKTRTSR